MATYKQRTTPGVYVTELDAFPNSVVGVQTAVPIFIGYTEKAELSGKPVYFKPTRIGSLADYEAIFGGSFESVYNIEEVPKAEALAGSGNNYDFTSERKDPTDPSIWTLTYYKFTKAPVVHEPPVGPADAAAAADSTLPDLAAFNLYNSLRLFYANGGGNCYIVSVGPYYTNGAPTSMSYATLKQGLDAAGEQNGPTMIVIPDAVALPADTDSTTTPVVPINLQFYTLCGDMLQQAGAKQDRVAILDVYGANQLIQDDSDWAKKMASYVEVFQEKIGEKYLNYGMAYFPFLVTSIILPEEIDYTNLNIHDTGQWTQTIKPILDDEAEYLYKDEQKLALVKGYIDAMPTTKDTAADPNAITNLNQNLVNAIPLMKQMANIIAVKMSMLPSSPAMAGVFTYNDGTRGVWNAPANISLSSVIKPNVELDNAQQGELNVPLNGKAIDVIRQFVGRGPVVWGARTLDGNSADWRYIQVRRTIIYIEQSIEAALQPFVFAANDGKTWVAVTSMVSTFLQGLWSQGGLMGDKADEAFTVSCGLGSTMTPQDVLDGYMIVQVTLQMIRPAEFIELTFKQKMQGLG